MHIRSSDPQVTPLIIPNSLATAEDVQDVFDGARVPADHLVGEEGHGFAIALGALFVAVAAFMALWSRGSARAV